MGHQGRRRRVPVPAAGVAGWSSTRTPAPTRVADHEDARRRRRCGCCTGPSPGSREDYAALRNNTAAAKLIEYTNHLTKEGVTARAAVEPLVLMVAPLAPHLAEELWRRLGHDTSLAHGPFPQADPAYLVEDTVEYPVQVNGKVRGAITVPRRRRRRRGRGRRAGRREGGGLPGRRHAEEGDRRRRASSSTSSSSRCYAQPSWRSVTPSFQILVM